MRASRADVDLDAVAHNVATLRALVAPAEVCAVVKADGYGHGALAVGQAALDAGASWLGVALVEEGAVLRRVGIEAPILLLSQPRPADIDAAVRLDLRLSAYTAAGVSAMATSARRQATVARLHLKVNTGMNRVGAAPADIAGLAAAVGDCPELELEALWTHCAVADEPANPFTDVQLDRFDAAWAELGSLGLAPPAAPRGQHRGRHRPPAEPLRPGPGRDRPVRAGPGTGVGRPGRPGGGHDPAGRGGHGQAGGGGRAPSPTASPTPSTATPRWPPCPSATPTA